MTPRLRTEARRRSVSCAECGVNAAFRKSTSSFGLGVAIPVQPRHSCEMHCARNARNMFTPCKRVSALAGVAALAREGSGVGTYSRAFRKRRVMKRLPSVHGASPDLSLNTVAAYLGIVPIRGVNHLLA